MAQGVYIKVSDISSGNSPCSVRNTSTHAWSIVRHNWCEFTRMDHNSPTLSSIQKMTCINQIFGVRNSAMKTNMTSWKITKSEVGDTSTHGWNFPCHVSFRVCKCVIFFPPFFLSFSFTKSQRPDVFEDREEMIKAMVSLWPTNSDPNAKSPLKYFMVQTIPAQMKIMSFSYIYPKKK